MIGSHVWDNEVDMYRMGRSTRNHKPHAAVVSIIFSSYATFRLWTCRVLDLASGFYLNRYIKFYLFGELLPSHRKQT